jgi:hypothetical protein
MKFPAIIKFCCLQKCNYPPSVMPMHSWSKIIIACLILLFSSVYSIALADEADEQRLQKLENLLEIYIKENKELKQKIQNLEVTTDTVTNKPANEIQEQLNRTTARARCEANIKGCSEQDLCAISTFTSSTGKRKWRAGDLKKFADEAKQRGSACGVENAANTKIETNTKPVATTARARCDANIKGCSKQDLCAISTFTSSTGKRKWRAGDLKKFADEAKQRGIACGVENAANTKMETNTKPVATTARARCEANLKNCNKVDLCELSTQLIGSKQRDWKVGVYRKFVTEAKRRGLTCNVPKWKNAPKPKPSKENRPKIKPQKNYLKLRYAKTSCQSQSAWLLTNSTIGFADNKLLCPDCIVIGSGDLEGGSIHYIMENDKAFFSERWLKTYDARLNYWYWTRYSKIKNLRSGVVYQDTIEYLFECK